MATIKTTIKRRNGTGWDELRPKTEVDQITDFDANVPDVINDLTNVNAPSPSDGQALVWDNSTSKWVPGTVTVDISGKVDVAGDTMTGNLSIENGAPSLTLKDTTDSDDIRIYFKNNSNSNVAEFTTTGNKLNIGTSFTNGLELDAAKTIISGGDVGIGTSSPISLLEVKAPAGSTGTITVGGGNTTVTAVGEVNAALDFRSNDVSVNNTNNIGGRIASITETTNGAYAGLGFYTFKQSRTPDLQEAMRINYDGKVGIGTTSPGSPLTVSGTIESLPVSTVEGGDLRLRAATGKSYQYTIDNYNDTLRFVRQNDTTGSSGTVRMIIDSSGNVGIGTASPNSKLHILNADPILTIQDTETTGASSDARLRLAESTTGNVIDQYWDIKKEGDNFKLQNKYGTTVYDRFTINGTNGNIGIGTTSPSEKLEVAGNINADELHLNDTNTKLLEGSSNSVRIQTSSGWIDVGPRNTSWSHFYTDRPRFYFGTGIDVDGDIRAYSNNTTKIQESTGHIFELGNRVATLASPALTGTPTAPTAAANTNNTQIATTAFVQNKLSSVAGGLNFKGTVSLATSKSGDDLYGTGSGQISSSGDYVIVSNAGDITNPTTRIITLAAESPGDESDSTLPITLEVGDWIMYQSFSSQTLTVVLLNNNDASKAAAVHSHSNYITSNADDTATGLITLNTNSDSYGRINGYDQYHSIVLRGNVSGTTSQTVNAGNEMDLIEYGGIFNFRKITPTANTLVTQINSNGIDIQSGNIYADNQHGFINSGAWTRNQTPHGYIDFGPANTSYAHIYTDRPAFYFNKETIYALGNEIWHSGNDGSGSGLDADTLDTKQASDFWQKSGSWAGDLTSNGYTREIGLQMTGGSEFAVLSKSGQGSLLVDGHYLSYESNNGFFGSYNSTYGNLTGIQATAANTLTVKQLDGGNANLTVTGTLTIDTGGTSNELVIKGTAPTISLLDDDSGADDFYLHTNSNNFYILADRGGANLVGTGWETPYPLQLEADTNIGYVFGQRIFNEAYHPNADKWTTARTLSLTGDVTGSVSWDGSANASITTTAAADVHKRVGTISTQNWNDYIDGTETGYNSVTNMSGSNKPSAYTYGIEAHWSVASQGKFQIYAPHNGSEGNGLHYRTGWNTDYDAWNRLYDNNYHPEADTWTTARTITLGGDLSGSVSLDGSANVTLSAQVANNSHQHSQLYENSTITYGASYLQWTDQSGNGGAGTNGAAPANPTNEWWHHLIMNHGNSGGYYFDIASAFHSDSMYFRRNVNGSLQSWRQIFHDTYHPNADKWTTARTITLGGDLTGNVSLDGSANVTLTATVADDSHNHTIANIDNLQTSLNAKQDSFGDVSTTILPSNGQVLKWNASASEWQPADDNNTDTDTRRAVEVNGTQILSASSTTPLDLKAGSGISISNSGGDVTITSSITNNVAGSTFQNAYAAPGGGTNTGVLLYGDYYGWHTRSIGSQGQVLRVGSLGTPVWEDGTWTLINSSLESVYSSGTRDKTVTTGEAIEGALYAVEIVLSSTAGYTRQILQFTLGGTSTSSFSSIGTVLYSTTSYNRPLAVKVRRQDGNTIEFGYGYSVALDSTPSFGVDYIYIGRIWKIGDYDY